MSVFLSALCANLLVGALFAGVLIRVRDTDLLRERRRGDIRQKTSLESQLASIKNIFLEVLQNCPSGIAILDMEGHWKVVNREVERILGRTSAELTGGMTWKDVTTEDTLQEDERQVSLLLSGENSRYTYDKKYIHAQDYEVPVTITVFVGELATERVFVAWIKDMTHERVEQTRREVFRAGATERIAHLESQCKDLRSMIEVRNRKQAYDGLEQMKASVKMLGRDSSVD